LPNPIECAFAEANHILRERTCKINIISLALLHVCVCVTWQEGNGTISFQTFQEVMATKMHARDPKEEAIKAFRLFDDDETGTISLKNLRRVAKELGENMTDDELQEVIDFCDKDGRGEILLEDFCSVLLAAQAQQQLAADTLADSTR